MAPFCESTFPLKLLMAYLNVHTRERKYLSLCILSILMPQITPLITFTFV